MDIAGKKALVFGGTSGIGLAGKKALVFGGTSGIGLATAQALAAEGATIVAISRDPDRASEAAGGGISLAACDVRDRDALESLFAEHAPFDILVNAATGGKRPSGPFLEMDLDGYQGAFDKLWGYTNTVRLGTHHMAEDGTIVLVSGAPARRAKPGQSAIASVGGAVEQFVRAVAPEIAPRRLNVVSPGVIDTPMFGPDRERRATMLGGATSKHLIPRPGLPEEVAAGILFLIKNDFVTGTTIDVDGGWLLS